MSVGQSRDRLVTPATILQDTLAHPPEFYGAYTSTVITGPLQTEDYARAVLNQHYPKAEAEQHTANRRRYSQLLLGSTTARKEIFLDEAALYYVKGDRTVTVSAVHALGDAILSPPPNTTIGILPFEDPSVIRPYSDYYIKQATGQEHPDITVLDGKLALGLGTDDYHDILDTIHPQFNEVALTGSDAYALVARAAIWHTNQMG